LLARFEDRENLLELELNTDAPNRARINKSDTPRVRDILGYVNAVIFSPEDLDIVKRDPSNRRAFIDELIVQLSPRMSGVYSDYERVLKQRNALLRSARHMSSNSSGLSTLDSWDQSLIKIGSEIISARFNLTTRIAPYLAESYAAIADEKNDPSVQLKSSLLSNDLELDGSSSELLIGDRSEIEELYRTKLETVRSKEIERGITLVGPHRDDLLLLLGPLPAKGYISHGESWSYALALKLASAALIRKDARAGDPVLILDDVFAELDATRRSRLAGLISHNEQVIITAAVAEDVPGELNATKFNVSAGTLEASDG
jgi:DNA replication and repair protein RecF